MKPGESRHLWQLRWIPIAVAIPGTPRVLKSTPLFLIQHPQGRPRDRCETALAGGRAWCGRTSNRPKNAHHTSILCQHHVVRHMPNIHGKYRTSHLAHKDEKVLGRLIRAARADIIPASPNPNATLHQLCRVCWQTWFQLPKQELG